MFSTSVRRARVSALSTATALSALCVALPAAAQIPSTEPAQSSDEIVVTAQKRETLLQETPLSVVALSSENLESRQITSFTDLTRIAPGLGFAAGNSPRLSGTSIRGIGTNTFSDAVEGAVGVNIDGVPIGRQGAAFVEFADLERIEVLRGPQGTLFGKNASAGVISIVTQAPEEELGVFGSVSYGSDSEIKAKGSVTGALFQSPILARLSAFGSVRDGIIENTDGRDLNSINDWGVRLRLETNPTDKLTLGLIADYSERNPDCCTWTTRRYGAGLFGSGVNVLRSTEQAAGIVAGPDNRRAALGGAQFTNEESQGVAGTIDWELGGYTLTSITAKRTWYAIDNNDADRTPLPLLDINQGALDQSQFSQELRIASPDDQRLSFVAGLFYFDQEVLNNSVQRGTLGLNLLGLLPPGLDVSRRQRTEVNTTNLAVFGEGTFALTDQLKAIAGARITREELEIDFRRDNVPGTAFFPGPGAFVCSAATAGPNCTPTAENDATSWRIGLQFQPQRDMNFYATVSRGYKGQAFNSQIDSSTIRVVRPEVPTAYELGARTDWLDGKLRANLTLFRTDFKDFQAQAVFVSPGSGLLTFDIVNAGELQTQGAEFEFRWRPTEVLTFNLNGAYTFATFASFTQAPCWDSQTLAQGCVTLPGGTRTQNLTGKPLPNAPEWTGSVGANYSYNLGEWSGEAGVNLFHRGEVVTALSNDPATRQEAINLLDLNLSITSPDDVFTLSLFGKNVTDESYVEAIFGTPFDTLGYSQFVATNARRTIGVSLSARY
jgi:iron complex outermembrane receptor protein